jgi:hypothetical protein
MFREIPNPNNLLPRWFTEYSLSSRERDEARAEELQEYKQDEEKSEPTEAGEEIGGTEMAHPGLPTWDLQTQRRFFQANWMDTPRQFRLGEFVITYKLEGGIYEPWISLCINIPTDTTATNVAFTLNHITSNTEQLVRDILRTNPHADRIELLRRGPNGEQLTDITYTAPNTPVSTHWGWYNGPGYSTWLNMTITHPSREADLDGVSSSSEDGED